MSTGAVVVVGNEVLRATASAPCRGDMLKAAEQRDDLPMVCLEVLGRSVLERSIELLRANRAATISIVMSDNLSRIIPALPTRFAEVNLVYQPVDLWVAVERTLAEYAAKGIQQALLMRSGNYLEFEGDEVLHIHKHSGQAITRFRDSQGPLDFWVVDTARRKKNGLGSSRPHLGDMATIETTRFLHGYTNRLRDAKDLRRLVVDSFLGRCGIRPEAPERKAGVWVEDEARVDRRARIVAPAYIGRGTKIEANTLITRFSSLESNCHVDYGTVVEDATILADTYLGACLDVSHAVVVGSTFLDLRRDVTVEIDDTSLVGKNLSGGSGSFSQFSIAESAKRLGSSFRRSGRLPPFLHQRQPVCMTAESNL